MSNVKQNLLVFAALEILWVGVIIIAYIYFWSIPTFICLLLFGGAWGWWLAGHQDWSRHDH